VNVRFEGKTSNGFAALDGDQVVHVAAFRNEDALRSPRGGWMRSSRSMDDVDPVY
jgi:hypothetical protein